MQIKRQSPLLAPFAMQALHNTALNQLGSTMVTWRCLYGDKGFAPL
jgi:hypothetical protein